MYVIAALGLDGFAVILGRRTEMPSLSLWRFGAIPENGDWAGICGVFEIKFVRSRFVVKLFLFTNPGCSLCFFCAILVRLTQGVAV